MANCNDYISADDLKTGKQAILHIEHVAKSRDANGNHALDVTDTIRGQSVTNKTLDGLENLYNQAISQVGYITMDSFEDGATLTLPNQVLRYKATGEYYRWDGEFPKTISAGSTPETAGGIGLGAWVSVGDAALRTSLASAVNGAGDALLAVKQPIASSVARTQHDYNLDRVSVKDWGAKGDGVTDDSAAINAACAALKGTFRELFFPAGTYVYNGAGMVIDNFVIRGEGQRTQINASANTNTGWLISLIGFSVRAESFYIVGNPSNINFKGIKSFYNSDNGGVNDVLVENFTYGLDIDKSWYATYENIRFRKTVPLTGADIRIGFNNPTEEVNNLLFKDIWMGEQQTNGVAIYSRTQVLTWLGCSFETKGGARIKFFTTDYSNTFQLNACYIEGDISTEGGAYFVEAQTITQDVTVNNSMFRLGSTTGTLGKNVTIYMNGGWSNSPNVDLYGGNTKIWLTNYRQSMGGFLNGPDYGRSGDYDGAQMHSAAMFLDPRPMDVRDWNAIIPEMINYKTHTNTNPVEVFKVYLPAATAAPKLMHLEIDILTKSTTENYIIGTEKYIVDITLPETATALSGALITKVVSAASSGASLLADDAVSLVSNGYDSATDSLVYTIRHAVANATRLGNSMFSIKGCYSAGGISTSTQRWKIQRL